MTVVVCVSVPLLPVTVNVNVPVEAFRLVVTVSVELDVGLAGFGRKEALVLFGTPLTLSVTELLNPLSAPIVTVYVVALPRVTVWLDGVAVSVKSAGASALTTRVAAAVWVSEPLVPVIVSG